MFLNKKFRMKILRILMIHRKTKKLAIKNPKNNKTRSKNRPKIPKSNKIIKKIRPKIIPKISHQVRRSNNCQKSPVTKAKINTKIRQKLRATQRKQKTKIPNKHKTRQKLNFPRLRNSRQCLLTRNPRSHQ